MVDSGCIDNPWQVEYGGASFGVHVHGGIGFCLVIFVAQVQVRLSLSLFVLLNRVFFSCFIGENAEHCPISGCPRPSVPQWRWTPLAHQWRRSGDRHAGGSTRTRPRVKGAYKARGRSHARWLHVHPSSIRRRQGKVKCRMRRGPHTSRFSSPFHFHLITHPTAMPYFNPPGPGEGVPVPRLRNGNHRTSLVHDSGHCHWQVVGTWI